MVTKFDKYLRSYVDNLARKNDISKELIVILIKKIIRMEVCNVISSKKTDSFQNDTLELTNISFDYCKCYVCKWYIKIVQVYTVVNK